MYKAKRQLEFIPENHLGEINDGISETIPGQALSVQEVLYKFTNGTLGNIGQDTYYDYEDEIEINDDVFNSYNPTMAPDWDITDADAYKRDLRNQKANKTQEEPLNEPEAKGDKENLKQENQTKEEE